MAATNTRVILRTTLPPPLTARPPACRGQFSTARTLLDEAEMLVAPTSWAKVQADTLMARAEVDRLAGTPERAEVSLRAALRIYTDRHATSLADQAAAALARITDHPSSRPARPATAMPKKV